MAEVRVEEEVAAPAAAVWDLLGDFGGVARWAGAVESCELEGEGVGAVRSLRMGGTSLRERLEAFDEAGRSFTYSMLEPAPLPVSDYRATVTVHALGDDRCRVEWVGTFEPKEGAPPEQVDAMVRGIYTGGIEGVRRRLGTG